MVSNGGGVWEEAPCVFEEVWSTMEDWTGRSDGVSVAKEPIVAAGVAVLGDESVIVGFIASALDGGFDGGGISKPAEGWPKGVQIRPPRPMNRGTLLLRKSWVKVENSSEIVAYCNNVAGTNVSLMICELIVAVRTVAPVGRGNRLVETVGFAVDSPDIVPVVATIPFSVPGAAEVGVGVGNISGLVEILDFVDIEGSEVSALKSPVPKLCFKLVVRMLEEAGEITPVPANEAVAF